MTALPQLTNAPPLKTLSSLPNGYPRRPLSLSPETKEDDTTSSEEHNTDPFSLNLLNNDNGEDDSDDMDDDSLRGSKSSTALDDRPGGYSGSAPHPSPSTDGSSTPPSQTPFTLTSQTEQPVSDTGEGNAAQDISLTTNRTVGQTYPEYTSGTRSSSRTNKDKIPPPPPRSHHGKRITAGMESSLSQPKQSQYKSRLSFHAHPDNSTSLHTSAIPNISSVSEPPAPDSFSVPLESNTQMTENPRESFQRSPSQNSQHKRPPTPPLSRRHSQMRRSMSTQLKSSGSRLTISSLESDRNDSSEPSSPDRSVKSVTSSLSQERKRISIPPPSSGELQSAVLPAGALTESLNSCTDHRHTQRERRMSSQGNIPPSSLPAAPPPPPPRRARDSSNRRKDGGPVSRKALIEEVPLPQPSNAHDILADLSRLQKEVDDLRGHYENRKVSQ